MTSGAQAPTLAATGVAMDSDQIARMIYLGLLAAAVAGSLVTMMRGSMSRTLQQAMVWVLIFIGVVAAHGLWSESGGIGLVRQSVDAESGQIILPRGDDGHYHAQLSVGGTPVEFVVDTGASDVVLTREDARRLGFDPSKLAYVGSAQTANGTVRTARVTLRDVQFGSVNVPSLRVSVNEGDLDTSLLGMAYLDRFQRIEISGNRMILTP